MTWLSARPALRESPCQTETGEISGVQYAVKTTTTHQDSTQDKSINTGVQGCMHVRLSVSVCTMLMLVLENVSHKIFQIKSYNTETNIFRE